MRKLMFLCIAVLVAAKAQTQHLPRGTAVDISNAEVQATVQKTWLMFLSLILLNAGYLIRVCSEIMAYEGYARHAWSVRPVSAVIELAAVTVFALNLGMTFLRPPAHLMKPAR